uniref:Uncharacterized protein n=2 Tax=Lotharella globosa TaxID=91324 RepID=A0A7S3YRB2_9EUKA
MLSGKINASEDLPNNTVTTVFPYNVSIECGVKGATLEEPNSASSSGLLPYEGEREGWFAYLRDGANGSINCHDFSVKVLATALGLDPRKNVVLKFNHVRVRVDSNGQAQCVGESVLSTFWLGHWSRQLQKGGGIHRPTCENIALRNTKLDPRIVFHNASADRPSAISFLLGDMGTGEGEHERSNVEKVPREVLELEESKVKREAVQTLNEASDEEIKNMTIPGAEDVTTDDLSDVATKPNSAHLASLFPKERSLADLGVVPAYQLALKFGHDGEAEWHDGMLWRPINNASSLPIRRVGSRQKVILVGFFERPYERRYAEGEKAVGDFVSFPMEVGFGWTSFHSMAVVERNGQCTVMQIQNDSKLEHATAELIGESMVQNITQEFRRKFGGDKPGTYKIFSKKHLWDCVTDHVGFYRLQEHAKKTKWSGRDSPAMIVAWEYDV